MSFEGQLSKLAGDSGSHASPMLHARPGPGLVSGQGSMAVTDDAVKTRLFGLFSKD